MDEYIKTVEDHNIRLQQKIESTEALLPRWIQLFDGTSHYWYYVIGTGHPLACITYVKDIKIEGFKVCYMELSTGFENACGIRHTLKDIGFFKTVIDAKQRVLEIFNGNNV